MLALNLPANKAGFASTTHNMLVLNLPLTSCCQWMYPHIMLALHRSTSHTDSPHVISECTTILCWHCTDLRVTLSCWHCTDLPVTLQCWIAQTSLSHYNAGLHRPTCHITMLDCTDLPVTLLCWIAQTYLSHYNAGLHRPTCHIIMLTLYRPTSHVACNFSNLCFAFKWPSWVTGRQTPTISKLVKVGPLNTNNHKKSVTN